MAKIESGTIFAALAVIALLMFVFKPNLKSNYRVFSSQGGYAGERVGTLATGDDFPGGPAVVPTQIGVSSSLLPKEIASQEDFGSFSPDAILAGQSYLDPRAQIGFPETTGGVLRNANWDVRSEPVNPRVPVSIWQNSTIVPDMMRPQFEIGR
jgi:hypothetical protein